MSQLSGLTEAQRGELSLKVSLSDSAARRIADLGKNLGQKSASKAKEVGATSTIGGSAHERAIERKKASGSSKTAMVSVAVLSAAVAGGSAYYFARGLNAASPLGPALMPAPSAPAAAVAAVTAQVVVIPAQARVSTPEGTVPVIGGVATLRGQPGETLSVTVEHQGTRKTFPVSLGSDGIATPGRLVLVP